MASNFARRSQIRPAVRPPRQIRTVVVDKHLVPKDIRGHWPPRLDLRSCSNLNQGLSVIPEEGSPPGGGGFLVLTPTERSRKLTTMSGRFFLTDVNVVECQSDGVSNNYLGHNHCDCTDFVDSVCKTIARSRRHSV